MLKKKNSLNIQILSYFLLFSILLLGFLWLFQVIFLDSFYRKEKLLDIKRVADNIKINQYNANLSDVLEELSFDNEVCVEIANKDNTYFYKTEFFGKGCIREEKERKQYMQLFINSELKENVYEIENKIFDTESLLYAVKLDNNRYAFINTSIDPIDSTTKILEKQLIIVTILVLLLSFVISYFISKYLSKPIITINDQAKNLSKGNFNIEFDDKSNIKELNELSNTLNYAKEELAKTEELRRDLMANVSHDLKTPLTMIKAYAEMTTDLHSNNKKKQKEDVEIIIQETDRLTNLVSDILDLSKMQSNINNLNIEEFDLIKLTVDILKRYKLYQETENYKFVFNHNKDEVLIKADKNKIEQVLYNLINNAINYTGEDNKVIVNIESDKETKVEITDTGKGIKEEELPYIWDRYYKNNKKHKRNLVGTGLGLSIVKHILEAHNYKYGVNTKIDQGTTFYFIIK